jgi:AAA ATPase domain
MILGLSASSGTGRAMVWQDQSGRPIRLQWPLVGRADELALIDQALAGSGTSGVVLAGAAGVGKTRLAREAVAAAATKGWVSRWAVATQAAASIPFGAVAHLLPTLSAGSTSDRFGLFRRAAELLVEGAGGDRLVLGVDDAHLLDDASAALVHQVAATSAGFVVVTIRSGARMPDPVVALWKDGLAERLEVQALARRETDVLIAAGLGGQVDGTTLHDLWQLTGGNPLFLRELLLSGLDSGALYRADEVWRWQGPMTAAPRLVELVEARIGRLEAEERDLLELVAFGEPLEAELLERMVAAPVLAAGERKGLVAVEEVGRRAQVRSAHPLYGEVLRGQSSVFRVRATYRRLADGLETFGARRSGDLLRVASWRLESGAFPRPEQLLVAARQAMAAFDYGLAERLARAAVDAGEGLDAEYLVGQALFGQGRVDDAEAALADLAAQGTTDQERAQVAITRALNLFWALNLPAKAKAVLLHAEAAVTDPAWREELATVRAGFLLYGGSCADALQAVAGVLDHPGEGTSDRVVLQALIVGTQAWYFAGRSDQAIAAAHQGFALERRLDEEVQPWGHLQLAMPLGSAYLAGGYLAEAGTLADDSYRAALEQPWPWPVEKAIWAGLRGQVARARGQVRTAMYWLREAAAAGRVDLPLPFMPMVLGELAHAAALLGDLATVEAALAEAERFTAESARIFQLWAALARPWVAVARGQRSTAVQLALEVAEQARGGGVVTVQLVGLHDVARLGQPDLVVAALSEAVIGAEGQLAPLYAAHATALAAHDGAALDTVASAFASIGANLLAAEAAT